MQHLRYAGHAFDGQSAALERILRASPLIWSSLERARELALPDWLIVSGAIYNTIWNHLTGRPDGHGIKDVDLFYHNGSDLSWEAEDSVIRRGAGCFAGLPLPVEIRNQARVHLWYPDRFGRECPAYESSAHALEYFASKTHAVGVRLGADDSLAVFAPFGLDHIFNFRMVPNRRLDNARTHTQKSARAKALWPELTIEPW